MPVTVNYSNLRHHPSRYVAPVAMEKDEDDRPSETFVRLANDLVREVARTGWSHAGVDVEIDVYGKGSNVFKRCTGLKLVEGLPEPAQISFSGFRGETLGSYYVASTASGFKMGAVKGTLYGDGSGDWNKDRIWEAAIAVVETALARLRALPTAEGFDDSTLGGDANLRRLTSSEPVPVPEGFPTLYAWIERNDAYGAIGRGRGDRDPGYREELDFVVPGNGWLFATADDGLTWDEIRGVANNGYSYASADPALRARGLNYEEHSHVFPVVIELNSLDDIYVYDFAPFEMALEAGTAAAEAEGRKDWNKGEYGGFKRQSLRTLVPATEYAGGYEKPMYLIGRQLRSDEARLIVGPISVFVANVDSIRTVMTDRETGAEILISEDRNAVYGMRSALGTAREVAEVLEVPLAIDLAIQEALEVHAERVGATCGNDGIAGMAV